MLATIAKRLAFIVLGYLVACYAAGLAIGRLTIVMVPDQLGGITQDSGTANNSLLEAGILSMPVAILMAIPTFLTLPFLEAGEIRNPIAYGIAGGAWGAVMELFVSHTIDKFTFIFAMSGVIAGLVYWAIAGRRAGQAWR